MNILLIGSGGRENAIAWKLAQSPLLSQLFIAPGNPGMKPYGTLVAIAVDDFENIGKFCIENAIEMVVVGPEVPLVKGIHDYFLASDKLKSISVIGPDSKGAMLEGSKDFSKQFMKKYAIPTADYQTFDSKSLDKGLAYLETAKPPYVLKADGLAAGKGVIITSDLAEAKATLYEMISDLKFGDASAKVVIEQFLKGLEVSVFALSDGKNYVLLPEAKDYKRIGIGDTGPNTGGMGAVSPVPFADALFMQKVNERIIKPTVDGLAKENILYKGFIFFGLIEVDNEPFVIEYNCRMGDPETEVVMPRIKSDLVEILSKVQNQKLNEVKIEFQPFAATTIMLVAGGYPDDYQKGDVITEIKNTKDVLCFHAGTKTDPNGNIVTNGGRVMALTGTGKNITEALEKSKSAAKTIQWKGKYFRDDIGFEFV
ncbi:MAG: phosphoribosylamine--glycine ligase [Bacteroidetes bacterium]|nr:MAG: phosphoribosylamine--glycine ligase [Bacteroidota bacterium]